jgi:hypothetical protein
VQGAPIGPDINFFQSHTSLQDAFGNLELSANSISLPIHFSTSFKNLKLSTCSSLIGLLTILTLLSSPYFSRVTFAATAEAAPQENQTTMSLPLIHATLHV